MDPWLDRRQVPDRRARPTTLWHAIRSQGRRTGFRRAGEGHQAYVDGLARRTLVLPLPVVVGSLLDAFLTLRYLHNGGGKRTRCSPWRSPAAPHSFSI